jgi:protein-tyrosine phosphatase
MVCDIADDARALIIPRLPTVITFIEEALESGQGVLVFCTDGVSRSAAIVIAYLMYSKRKTYSEAYSFVKLKRSVAKPNFGLVKQLMMFEETLKLKMDLGSPRKSEITKSIIN